MLRSALASTGTPRTGIFERLWTRSRTVEVKVYDWGLIVDSFRAASPATLKDALLPIYAHPDEARGAVRFVGIEVRSLPFGFGQTLREVSLSDLTSTVCFLEG